MLVSDCVCYDMQVVAIDTFKESGFDEYSAMFDESEVSYGRKSEDCKDCPLILLKTIANGR